MNADEAIAFVENHGVVLASGKGPVPSLAEAIADEPISGSWWAHPRGRKIFAIFRDIDHNPDILVCRLVKGKITFVHRRLWPALVRASGHFPWEHLAQIHQEHSEAGHHVNRLVDYPGWVTADVYAQAAALGEKEALSALGAWAAGAGE